MKNEINAVLENMTAATPEPEDYTGEDGLLYCGKCRKPKEAYDYFFPLIVVVIQEYLSLMFGF